jgi:phosphoesterase RecJ-like protein
MELSPKQQTVELVKKAERILILGHKSPDGDLLGSALALSHALSELKKSVELVITDDISDIYKFLPNLQSVKTELSLTEGKILRIDTDKFPISGMKYKKDEKHLDIILNADKNLKFEHVEIINGVPKPDLIIILDTPDVEKIDDAYDKNTELFFEVPIVNIDHHPGNEYFGTINLVDLTASSTAEILVSLFEALGVKIADPDTATCLLLGIIGDTQSFRSNSTTPKSLTVAAQLLAAGAKQQDIISNLYKKRPMALLKLWGEMLSGISLDAPHRFAWTKVRLADIAEKGIAANDVLDAADELLSNTPDADTILIMCETKKGEVLGKLKGAKGKNVLELAKLFGGDGIPSCANFTIKETSLSDAEMKALKRIHDFWGEKGENENKEVWDVIAKEDLSTPQTEEEIEETTSREDKPTPPVTKEEIEEATEEKDVIDSALKSLEIEQKNKENTLTPLKEVLLKKKSSLLPDEDIDVFSEEDEK